MTDEPQDAPPPTPPLPDVADDIERWFVERIHNSPVSRATEIYNHIRAAVDDLKQRLAARMQEF